MNGEMVSEGGDKVPVVSGNLVLPSHLGPVQVGHLPVQDAAQEFKVVMAAVVVGYYLTKELVTVSCQVLQICYSWV